MITIYTTNETEEWNKIVKSFKHYDTYYLSNYSKAFEIHGDGKPILFFFQNKDIKAINVVMKRDIGKDEKFRGELPLNTYFDITTPYGYGGFLIEGKATKENLETLNEQYVLLCQREGIISEFVRFHPVLKNSEKLEGIYDITELGKTITMDLEEREKIWENLISKNRNMIRKAQKFGIEIFWGLSPELIENFIELYNATMDKDNAKDYYYFKKSFYESILKDLKHNSMIFYAMNEGKVIAMSMILFSNNQMHYHLSASNKEYQNLAPTNLLLYEAAIWGCENGYETFHLGGGLGSTEDNLYKFKKVFNRESETRFSIGRKIFNNKEYEKLVNIRNNINNIENIFFPKYRM